MKCLEETTSTDGLGRRLRCDAEVRPGFSHCRRHSAERLLLARERRETLLERLKVRAVELLEASLKTEQLNSDQRQDREAWLSIRWEIEHCEQGMVE